VEWDKLLPDDLGTCWCKWVTLLPHLWDVHIPRWAGTRGKGKYQTLVFCNASERAYGAALYIRSTDGSVLVLLYSAGHPLEVNKGGEDVEHHWN